MGINATVSRVNNGGWLFTWPVGTAPYPIYLDGLLIATAASETYTHNGVGYDTVPPDLEILNTGDAVESTDYPPYQTLQWRGILAADGYLIEQLISAIWVEKGFVYDDDSGYYTWASPVQADDSTAQWRVTAVDRIGGAGTPITFTIDVARNPARPLVDFTVDSAGDIVASES